MKTLVGIWLEASPPCTWPIETTADSIGSTLRETLVCSATMRCPIATIGSWVCSGSAAWPAGVPSLAHLVLNDVGPQITHASVARIGAYAGDTGHYASEAEALQALQERFAAFGPRTPEEWARLNRPMLRPHPAGGLRLHYDPALADAFREVPREAFDAGTQVLWKLYDALSTPTLVIRGAESDLLTPEAAHAMQMRGPHAHVVEIAGAGHAPALDHAAEMQPIADFLLGSSGVSRV